MLDVIAQGLAQAITVAVSPMPLIALIVLMVAGSRAAALAWTAGWLGSVAVMIALATAAGRATPVGDVADDSGPNYLAFVIAGLFLFLAWRSLSNRPAPGMQVDEPAWLSTLGSMSPVKVFGVAAFMMTANAKNLPIYASLGASISAADLSTLQSALTTLILAALSSVTAIGVLAVAVVGGDSTGDLLERWRVWLVQHNAVVMGILFLVLGVSQLGTAIGSV